jgi:ABC-type multidrug transport system fused ATPase/permease subunit
MYKPLKLYLASSPSIENMLKAPDPHNIKEMLQKISQNCSQSSTHARPSFTKTMIKSLYKPYLKSALLTNLGQVITILQSLLINSMVEYLYQKDSSYSEPLILSIIFIFSSFLIVITQGLSNYNSLLLSGQILITEKILKLNNSSLSKQDFTGKIYNTLSTDFEIFELIHYSLYVFSIPIVATVAIVIIYFYFDVIGIIGVGLIILHLPLIALISNLSSKFREKAEKICDTRVKMIERLIHGIKLMKFYVWEKKFYEKISEERRKGC